MTLSSPNTLTPRPSRTAQKALSTSITTTNALDTPSFIEQYFPPDWSSWTHPRTNEIYTLTCHRSGELTTEDFTTCYDIIESTSGHDYRNSSIGWSETHKKTEMSTPELRYILIRSSSNGIQGFLSCLPTIEASQPVLYIYEIHLLPPLQASGLGSHIFKRLLQPIARSISYLDKIMLTCFRSNEAALGFYERMGLMVDGSSPGERRLRGGKVVTSDYVILSWRIDGVPLGDGGGVTE